MLRSMKFLGVRNPNRRIPTSYAEFSLAGSEQKGYDGTLDDTYIRPVSKGVPLWQWPAEFIPVRKSC